MSCEIDWVGLRSEERESDEMAESMPTMRLRELKKRLILGSIRTIDSSVTYTAV